MNILILGMAEFLEALRDIGHDVRTCGPSADYEVVVSPEEYSVPGILSALGDWAPDICLFIETLGNRTFPSGLQNRPFPLVYYSIDTHLNWFWLKHFATTCDAVITTQKDFVPLLQEHVPLSFWLPWSNNPDQYFDVGAERDIPISFVGAVDDFRPRRKALLALIATRYPIHVVADRIEPAEVNALYGRSKIVVNEAIAGEVNFRVFEAMASGAMLLTDRVGNGLSNLFVDGEHLVTFGPEDILDKVGYYLAHEEERFAIATAGTTLVQDRHTRYERAKTLSDFLSAIPSSPVKRPTRLGKAYFFMLRRGLLPDGEGLNLAYQALVEEASACSTGERLADVAAFLTSFAEGSDGAKIYRRIIGAGCRQLALLWQWSLLLLSDAKDDEAKEVLTLMCEYLDGEERRHFSEALEQPFPSAKIFRIIAQIAERSEDSSVPGFVHFKGNQVPFSGSDVISAGLLLHPDDPDLLELAADLSMTTFAPVAAADLYLRAVTGRPTGPLLRKASVALADAFMVGEALEAAKTSWALFGDQASAEFVQRLQVVEN